MNGHFVTTYHSNTLFRISLNPGASGYTEAVDEATFEMDYLSNVLTEAAVGSQRNQIHTTGKILQMSVAKFYGAKRPIYELHAHYNSFRS